ncbi:22648_t:CDS:1, partial [Gigaspora margarita]
KTKLQKIGTSNVNMKKNQLFTTTTATPDNNERQDKRSTKRTNYLLPPQWQH